MIFGCIIPHAGRKYAGQARESAFKKILTFTQPKHIFYLSAKHQLSPDETQEYYILDQEGKNSKGELDHSFNWVQNELMEVFPSAQITVYQPTQKVNASELARKIVSQMRDGDLLIATTDLTHYGVKYDNTSFAYPQQYTKMKVEEDLIFKLTSWKSQFDELQNEKVNFCGPYAIGVFVEVMKILKWNGMVTDYYDSSQGGKYVISSQTSEPEGASFVSYVSMVFSSNMGVISSPSDKDLQDFDIQLGLGLLKATIQFPEIEVKIPKWCPLKYITQGIFVGTEVYDEETKSYKTNCSYGQFENSDLDKVILAGKNCQMDAQSRWNEPYVFTPGTKIKYKIEFLQPKSEWKTWKLEDFLRDFKLDNRGVYLTVQGRSATYLPIVAQDYKDKWTVEEYLNQLTLKTGAFNEQAWKLPSTIIQSYETVAYYGVH